MLRQRGGEAGDDLRGVLERPLLVAGVDALGAEADVEVLTGFQFAGRLQDGDDDLAGGAGVGGGFQDDGGAGVEVHGDLGGGAFDVAEVGCAFGERGGDGDDGDVEVLQASFVVRGEVGAVPSGEVLLQFEVGDVLDVGDACSEHVVAVGGGFEAGHVVTRSRGGHGQGESDVSLTHDEDLHRISFLVVGHRTGVKVTNRFV